MAETSENLAADLTTTVRRLVRRLRTASPETGLTTSQRSALSLLDEGSATTAALARAEHVRPQSMRLTIGALEAEGLVGRAPDPDDGRQSVVSMTDKGRAVLAETRAAKHTWLAAAIADRLDEREREQLADAVALLERLIRP
ncbi:MarR family winged helix-turn-helix transcriptional regulator [Streptomyces sp. NPDC059063]|uniref:MarR family winged helix-turn-helix transcriptional regulator n=1 Tax=unclassified Streptomyces TaxID=2593676 RepID=UPI00367B69C9